MSSLKIILDTDIGPDCDDTGALAVLHALANSGEAEILGVTHCTSNPYGAGCIDAINRFYKRPSIPVGTLSASGFLDEQKWYTYNKFVTEKYDNSFRTASAPDATTTLRQLLAKQPDGSVVFVAIGPLVNLANLLTSEPDEISELSGVELVRAKVLRLVSMAGRFAREDSGELNVEWNVEMDIVSAKVVCDTWPTPVIFCPFEVGVNVVTGKLLMQTADDTNPVKKSYDLYTNGNGRSSWDLVTVLFAVRGDWGMWALSPRGRVAIDDAGHSLFTPDTAGMHSYVVNIAPIPSIESYIDDLLIRAG